MASSTVIPNAPDKPKIIHSFSEPYLLSESSTSNGEPGLPSSISGELKPVIKITTTGSTATSTNCSTESMMESSHSNSTASETIQVSDTPESSATEVDIVQEAKSPCLNNPVRVRIQYPCSLYQDSNYVPPKKLSSMIQEMIKDGMPRLMKKIIEETKLSHKKTVNIFNFDVLPPKQGTTSSQSTTDATTKLEKPVGSISEEEEIPDVASSTLSKPPDTSNVCETPSSDSPKPNDDAMETILDDNNEVDQYTLPKGRSMTLPTSISDLLDYNKLQRSNSLMSERRRMDILRNMSQSVKDRLRRHSSSAAATSAPSSLDLCPTSTNSSPMSNTPTGSCGGSPSHYSVNVTISNTVRKPHEPQVVDEMFVPSSKNKVRRWISFNYGDKTKSKAAQKYMKHLEQKRND